MTTRVMTLLEMDREVDLAVAGSFPASDPPPWTLGATPLPPLTRGPYSPAAAAQAAAIDVVIAASPGRFPRLAMLEVIGMMALVPAAILLAAVPILLVIWGFGAAARVFGG
jgi:hypothetical protein